MTAPALWFGTAAAKTDLKNSLDRAELQAEYDRIMRALAGTRASILAEKARGNIAGVEAVSAIHKRLAAELADVVRRMEGRELNAIERTQVAIYDAATAVTGGAGKVLDVAADKTAETLWKLVKPLLPVLAVLGLGLVAYLKFTSGAASAPAKRVRRRAQGAT